MSDHDTSDAALVAQLRDLGQRFIFQGGSPYALTLADALARRIADGARLATLLKQAAPYVCPNCGPHAKVDEDGCCAACGADCALVAEEYER